MSPGLRQALKAFTAFQSSGLCEADNEPRRGREPVFSMTGHESPNLRDLTNIRTFALLPSKSNARLLVPVGNSRSTVSGLRIYIPLATKARCLKRLLVIAARIGWTGRARDKITVASRQPLAIESLVSDVTGEKCPSFALALGTDSLVRKLCIQVMRPDGEILGYVKLPMAPDAVERVRREAAILERLRGCIALGPQIPRVLHAGEWHGGYILFQSPGPSMPAPVTFGSTYRKFLQKLWAIESVEKPGSVLTEEVGVRWSSVEGQLSSEWRSLGESALRKANRELRGLAIQCGVTHGDLAPWNGRRMSNGDLYVFDWESADWRAPLNWDIFHFHVQVSTFLKSTGMLFSSLNLLDGERASFLLYLLNSVCHSIKEKSSVSERVLDYRRRLLRAQLSVN